MWTLSLVANLRLVLEEHRISVVSHAAVLVSVLVFYLWALLLNVAWALTGNFDTYYGEGQGTRHEARPMGQLGRMGNQHSRRSRSCHGFV
mmetsp:Transcript_4350/g.12749  ORF Transcript_4350/g.12749 Transcript_4350/m.12749 type:complete len:90 (+) Transcript_4350:627-896(+)